MGELDLNQLIADHLHLYLPDYTESDREKYDDIAEFLRSRKHMLGDFRIIEDHHYYKLNFAKERLPDKHRTLVQKTLSGRHNQSPSFVPILVFQDELVDDHNFPGGKVGRLVTNLIEREIQIHFLHSKFTFFEYPSNTALERTLFVNCLFQDARLGGATGLLVFRNCHFNTCVISGSGDPPFLSFNESSLNLLISNCSSHIEYSHIKSLCLFLLDNLDAGCVFR